MTFTPIMTFFYINVLSFYCVAVVLDLRKIELQTSEANILEVSLQIVHAYCYQASAFTLPPSPTLPSPRRKVFPKRRPR